MKFLYFPAICYTLYAILLTPLIPRHGSTVCGGQEQTQTEQEDQTVHLGTDGDGDGDGIVFIVTVT